MNNLNIVNAEQGSEEWIVSKLGVISASNISCVLAKKGTATREGYISELVAQVATGEMAEISGPALRWGKEQEQSARSAYEFSTGSTVSAVGFIYGKDKRTGCSPDGIIGDTKGLEIKCPYTSKVHVDFLAMEKIKLEYIYQVQFSMWITGIEEWDFCSFDPRFKKQLLKIHSIKRDAEMMKRFDDEVPSFISEMDVVIKKIGLRFGEQWESL